MYSFNLKQVYFLVFFCFFFLPAKAQRCDTIVLNNGATYRGVIIAISQRVVKIINCDTSGILSLTFYRKDIKKFNYDKALTQLRKRRDKERVEKEALQESIYKAKQDTNKYWHIGVIPYQFLTRSSALYFRYDLKKISLEYRPSYTYATNLSPNEMFAVIYHDNFYFQGINNSVLLYFPKLKRVQVGLMLSYKHWWHGNKPILSDNSVVSGKDEEYYLIENRSTVMNGFGLGLDFVYNLIKRKNTDFNFYWNASATYFNAHSYVYSVNEVNGNSNYPSKTYPYTETKDRFYFNLTCGFKIGYKKQLK